MYGGTRGTRPHFTMPPLGGGELCVGANRNIRVPGMIAIRKMLRFVLLIAWSTLAAQQYTISTFAGIGPPWRQPTPVPATQAYIEPIAVTADKAGNVYVTGAYSVYKIDPSGILNRIAGNDPYS